MEKDKILKALIEAGAVKKASPHFTLKVMAELRASSSSTAIVNKKWIKVFRVSFFFIAILVILLSFVFNQSLFESFYNFQINPFPPEILFAAFHYILAFWLTMAFTLFINKRSITTYEY